MISQQVVQQQLDDLGVTHKHFGRAELRELKNILVPHEVMQVVANGFYSGGFATIVATDKRIIIVDKKPFILNIEDLRYEMISEVNFESKVLDAQICIHVPHKMVSFRSWHQPKLRELSSYIQERVMQTYTDWLQRQRYGSATSNSPQPIMAVPIEPTTTPLPLTSSMMPRPQPFKVRRPAHILTKAASRLAIKQLNSPTVLKPSRDF